MTSVVTSAEYGLRGYQAQVERHGLAQVNRWRAMGGRRRNPTLAEIEASTGTAARLPRTRTTEQRKEVVRTR